MDEQVQAPLWRELELDESNNTDWKSAVASELKKFKALAVKKRSDGSVRYIACTFHKKCPVKVKVETSQYTSILRAYVTTNGHAGEEKPRGMSHNVIEVVESLLGAKIKPKTMRIILRDRYNISEADIPSARQLCNHKQYWNRTKRCIIVYSIIL